MTELSEILLLGDPNLYKVSLPVKRSEWPSLQPVARKMADLIVAFRSRYGKGRGIAAPQIGVLKRLIVLNIDKPVIIINPEVEFPNQDKFSLWDDCMSFPNLLVRVERYQRCHLRFVDETWKQHSWVLEGDMAELIQHEFDHLEGILATQRAINTQSFRFLNI